VFFVVIFIVIFAQNGYCSLESLAARLIVQEGKFSGFFGSSSGISLYVSSAKNNSNISGNKYYVSYASYRTYSYDDRQGEYYGLAGTVYYYDKYGEHHVYSGFVVGHVYSASGVRKDDSGAIIGMLLGGDFYDTNGEVVPEPFVVPSNWQPCFIDSDNVVLVYLNPDDGNFYNGEGNRVNYPTYDMLLINDSFVGYIGSDLSFVDRNGVYYPPNTWSFEGNMSVISFLGGAIALFNKYNDVDSFLGKEFVEGKYVFQPFIFPGPIALSDNVFYPDQPRPNPGTVEHPDLKEYPTIPPGNMPSGRSLVPDFSGSGGSGSGDSGSGGSGSGGSGSGGSGSGGSGSGDSGSGGSGSGGSGSGGSGSGGSGSGDSGSGDSEDDDDPITLPWTPDPDPDSDSNPNSDPPPTPDPPEPPNPGVGGTVNQYNDIVQNNDYSVTNNDNRSYSYDFNDNGTYSADGMFSDLSLSTSVPSLINQRASQMMSSVGSALGVGNLMNVMRVASNTNLGKFCIDKPLSNLRFRGRPFVPEIVVCLDLDELSRESYIQMIRMVLLFMVYFIFVTSVYNVLLRF
jgi:hypothetical protein